MKMSRSFTIDNNVDLQRLKATQVKELQHFYFSIIQFYDTFFVVNGNQLTSIFTILSSYNFHFVTCLRDNRFKVIAFQLYNPIFFWQEQAAHATSLLEKEAKFNMLQEKKKKKRKKEKEKNSLLMILTIEALFQQYSSNNNKSGSELPLLIEKKRGSRISGILGFLDDVGG